MINNFEYVKCDLNTAELDVYLNTFIQQSLKNPFTCDLNTEDFLPAVPELYLAKWMLGTCVRIVEKMKGRIETLTGRGCSRCNTAIGEPINLQNKGDMGSLGSFSEQFEMVHIRDVNVQQLKASDSAQGNIKKERAPLTPIKDRSNVNRQLSSSYFSPKQLEDQTKFTGTLKGQDNVKNALGSPVHCSTQMYSRGHLNNVEFDENMKIKNSSTPKKKKISPVKIMAINSVISQQQPLSIKFEEYLNESNESVDILPATPTSEPRKTGSERVSSKKSKKKISIVTEDEEELVLTPIIKRLSETESAQGTPEKPNVNFEDSTEGISPSIIRHQALRRNLMTDSRLGISDAKSSSTPLPTVPITMSLIPTQDEPQFLYTTNSSDGSKQQKKNIKEWVSTSSDLSFSSNNGSTKFKRPVFNRDKKYKQITLPQMKKKSPTKNVDISTLDEFKGGVRPTTHIKTSLKRKSDESDRENEVSPTSKVPVEVIDADETFFAAPFTLPKSTEEPKRQHRAYKKGKADTNFTEELIADFDKLPNRESQEPNFAYKPEKAIRKKDERAKLTGWDCEDCRGYYEAIDANDDPTYIQKRKDMCSKHRSKHPINLNGTPEGYWETDFPSTLQLKQQKMLNMDSFIDSD